MIGGKQLLYLFAGIAIALACYLFYIDTERKQSVALYFSSPQIGDVYKIKRYEDDGKRWVHYLKLKEINDSGLVFMRSKMAADASSDYLLNHYNETSSVVYTYKELAEIKDGKWETWQKDNTKLIEIKRDKK